MSKFPEVIEKAWENRKGPIVLTTINEKDTPVMLGMSS